jgi:hypothetical protein
MMSHTYRINPETYEEEVERRYLDHKKRKKERDERLKLKEAALLEEANDESSN